MSTQNLAEIQEYLNHFKIPGLNVTLHSLHAIQSLSMQNQTLMLTLQLGFPAKEFQHTLEKEIQAYLAAKTPLPLKITISWKIIPHQVQSGLKPLPQIKNIIAIASGKGGVGKSTTAVNIALALYREGAQVGLLDADIYGPNQPQMLGLIEKPTLTDDKKMEPVLAHGLQTMSIGYLVDANAPMVWRGPMVSSALTQLLNDTHWTNLDYLVIDLPPGTGDVQLTLAQKIPVSGAVIITTPQEIALLDVRKAINMFKKVNVPILGVVENMSTHICNHCGAEESIFGEGGGEFIAEQFETTLLGSLPLSIHIREQGDKGTPIVMANTSHPASLQYMSIARKLAVTLAGSLKNFSGKFPKIEIQDR